MKRGVLTVAVLLLAWGALTVAEADPIGPTDCTNDSCFGNVFTLEFANLIVNNGTSEVDVTLTIDTTDTTLSSTDVIRDVGFKITSSTTDIVGTPTLTSTTAGTTSDWTVVVGGLANDGCAAGAQGFVCASDADVAPLERAPFHEALVAIVEIVVDDDVMPGAFQRQAAMRAHIARPAGN